MNPFVLLMIVLVICVLGVYTMATHGPKVSISLFFLAAFVCFLGYGYSDQATNPPTCHQSDAADDKNPQPDTCVQVVVLEADLANADGSHTYNIHIDPVGYLAPYKMAHEKRRLIIPYSQLDSTLQAIKYQLAGSNGLNQIYLENYFDS
jgi:hypothetical protein